MSRKKVLLYPCGKEDLAIIQHIKEKSNRYMISSAVAPISFLKEGRDLGNLDNRYPLGLVVHNDFEEALDDCELVLFLEVHQKYLLYQDVVDKIVFALKKRKSVKCAFALLPEDVERLKKIAEEYNSDFLYFSTKPEGMIMASGLYKIGVPIVFIGDMHQYSHSNDVLIAITEELKNRNYTAVGIIPNRNDVFIYYEVIPDFLVKPGLKEDEKVVYFNQFIHEIEKTQQPDIILIGMPSPLMQYAQEVTQSYGIVPIIIGTAANPDFLVVCAGISSLSQTFIDSISNYLMGKIGAAVDALAISNYQVDHSVSIGKGAMIASAVNADKIYFDMQQNIENIRTPTYYIHKKDQMRKMVDQIVDFLAR